MRSMHEGKVRLTARHFGYSPDTISWWVRAYNSGGVRGLEPGSRRPKRVRQPQALMEVVERVRAVREQYPRWGREKLRALRSEEGPTLSAKSIDRVIGCLKARGVLREAVQPRKAVRWRHTRLRRPRELVVDSPGALVQMDSKQVAQFLFQSPGHTVGRGKRVPEGVWSQGSRTPVDPLLQPT